MEGERARCDRPARPAAVRRLGRRQRPAPGLDGFAAALRQAQIAARLGAARAALVSHHRDIALEALPFGGPRATADFVRTELGELAGDKSRVVALRETVAVYFRHGSSAGAAAELGIAERTVTYRLRRAEEILGIRSPPAARRSRRRCGCTGCSRPRGSTRAQPGSPPASGLR